MCLLECWLAERVSVPVVGMLVLEADWIDQLYVDPDLTRAGIGTELIAVAIAAAVRPAPPIETSLPVASIAAATSSATDASASRALP